MAIRINGVDRDSTLREKSSFVHGTYHMADNTNLYEPQRTNDFEFVVTDLEGLVGIGTENTIANAQEILRLAVMSTDIPHFTQEAIPIRRGNGVLKFAGVPSFGEGRITVQDWIGADTKKILMSWQDLSYNVKTQKVGLASDYKKDAYLVEYTPDKQVVRRWRLFGCWISGISESSYDRNSSNANVMTVVIQYDNAEVDTTDID